MNQINNMKNTLYSLFLLLLSILPAYASGDKPTIKSLLKELDRTIAMKADFHKQREHEIDSIRKLAHATPSPEEKYHLYSSLYGIYLHYQADSALHYLEKRKALLPSLQNPQYENDLWIARAEVLGIMGLYNEVAAQLEQVRRDQLDNQTLLYYYYTCRTYYGWIADYTRTDERHKYIEKTNAYRDSILSLTTNQLDHSVVLADKMIVEGQADKAIELIDKELAGLDNQESLVYLLYNLSQAYAQKGDTEKQINYLAQTPIADQKTAKREYISLQKLALLMFEKGDIERAYKYLSCSMEDAVACNARLRSVEVTEFFPIVDKVYKLKIEKEKQISRTLLISVSFLSFLLLVTIIYLYRQMKKLSLMRKAVSASNEQLQEINKELSQASKIKEEYIALYLNQCVIYLDKLDTYRRSLAKLAMASKLDDLFKTIKSEQFIRDERKNFYNEFDKSFLKLFPHFIKSFNDLMSEEGKLCPKSGEILSTELRIFALIRLGINDSSNIAHFLGYSLATVYSYRSKVRSKALDKEKFEEEVASL